MIGNYGDIVFETNDKRILTFNDFTRSSGGRWAKHDIVMKKPVLEFLGPDLDRITFTITLNGKHGVRPRHEMERWLIKEREGTAEFLFIGNNALGVNRWVVKSVSQVWETVLNRGEVYSGKVDIELEEYVSMVKMVRK
jgi:phage protein U